MEFNELDAGSYTVDVEATLSGALSGVGSAEVAVTEGETASCSVLMNRVYTAAQAAERIAECISDDNGKNWNIIVAGAIDDAELSNIATKLYDVSLDGCISLDLGRTTGLSSIGATKFQNCTALSAIVLPEGIDSINESAFEGCTSLASVTIPDTVNEIGQFAFKKCTALESITIPNGGIQVIASSVFSGCSALKSVTIPNSVTSIGDSAFENCSALESIVLPEGITEIGYKAFHECSTLKSIKIPKNVTKIEAYCFRYCSALETVEIPESVTEIGERAFDKCDALTTVNYGGTEAEWENITIKSNNPPFESDSGVTIIFSNGATKTL